MKKDYLECGRIVGAHGVKGLMKVECWCDSPKILAAQKRVFGRGDFHDRIVCGGDRSAKALMTVGLIAAHVQRIHSARLGEEEMIFDKLARALHE